MPLWRVWLVFTFWLKYSLTKFVFIFYNVTKWPSWWRHVVLPSMFTAGLTASVSGGASAFFNFFALILDDLASSSIREGGWARSSCTKCSKQWVEVRLSFKFITTEQEVGCVRQGRSGLTRRVSCITLNVLNNSSFWQYDWLRLD